MKKKEEQQGKKQVKYEKEFAVFQVDKKFYNFIYKDGNTTAYMDVKTYVDQGRTMIPVLQF